MSIREKKREKTSKQEFIGSKLIFFKKVFRKLMLQKKEILLMFL